MKVSSIPISELLAQWALRLYVFFLAGIVLRHLVLKLRRPKRKAGPAAVLLLLSGSLYAQGTMPSGVTVQNYDSTSVPWTLPPGMSHKEARQAVLTLTKLGPTLTTAHLTAADSAFLYKWMPGVLNPPRRVH